MFLVIPAGKLIIFLLGLSSKKYPHSSQTSQPWNTGNLELEAQKSGDFSKNLEIAL